ncbi:hypothetical protein KUCAC02_018645 [Chaenocephalus aceratus]|uniref:Uncharacterized protein n=1 Tax=Chaenocephalus aceratus TaxID=36190 RepID=A0ACB9WAH4_CHAAC|nr:hypothetical protein KUCAC02_018645 [Chaenocephalus aceratus]
MERDREKPTNHKCESKHGSRAGQEASKRRGEKALLLTRKDMAKEKAVVVGAAQSEKQDLRQVKEGGGPNNSGVGNGGRLCHLVPRESLNPLGSSGSRGWESCSKS